jgi:hypothetical protein
MRAARLGMNLVGTSFADERAFSCMTFIKLQLADKSVDKLSPSHAMKLQKWVDLVTFPSCEISKPHVDLGRSLLLAWRCSGKSRCLFVTKMHACLKLSFNKEQKKIMTGEKQNWAIC